MRAARYHGAHDVRIEEVAVPERRLDEVLIRIVRSGICGTDASEWKAGPIIFPIAQPHRVTAHVGPLTIGHEFVGEIVAAPSGSRYSHGGPIGLGDLVASGAGVWCGECDRCREGRTNLCQRYFTYGLSTDGGMAEFASVAIRTLVPVPAGINPDVAGLAQPLAVGLHAARRSGVRSGDRVVIIGSGAIGTFVLMGLLSLHDDLEVAVVDFPGPRLERAKRLGAASVVEVTGAADADERVLPTGVDVVIEASGAPGQLNAAIGMVRDGGTILQVGLPAVPPAVNIHALVMREITVRTSLAHICDEDLAPALDVLATSNLASELLEGVFPLEQLTMQLDRLVSGKVDGKVLFDPAMGVEGIDRG